MILLAKEAAGSSYVAGSKLAIKITCPAGATTDPNFTFTLTNLGSSPVDVPTEVPIDLKVHLKVEDSSGKVLDPGYYDNGMRSISAPQVLGPGKSLELMDWVDHFQPQTSVIPLHLFGYNLSQGTYFVSAKATDSPDEPASNVCKVIIN